MLLVPAGITRDACFTHALHLAGAHRAYHTARDVQIACAVGAFVAREVGRVRRAVLKLAVLARCTGMLADY